MLSIPAGALLAVEAFQEYLSEFPLSNVEICKLLRRNDT